jgi:2-alkyl-3-oxoalkanoate reductase
MKFFVSGAAGLAGHAVVEKLRASGREVRGLVRREADASELRAMGAEVVVGDLSDPRELTAQLEGCTHVVHAAGIADERAPLEVHGWTHVAATENLIRASRHAGVRRFVFISCADVSLMGRQRRGVNEDQDPGKPPIGRLGRTKYEAEEIVLGMGSDSFEPVVLRPGLLWGPRDRCFLPRVAALGCEGRLRLVGEGESMMATTHAQNLAEAAEKASLSPLAAFGVYYIVDPQMVLQRDFVCAMAEALALPRPRKGAGLFMRSLLGRLGAAPSDFEHVEACRLALSTSFDGTRARQDLDYRGELTVDEGFAALAEWIRSVGGAEAVRAMARTTPGLDAIARQRQIADEMGAS